MNWKRRLRVNLIYHLHQGYDGEYSHSVDYTEVNGIPLDDVSHYRKLYPAGPARKNRWLKQKPAEKLSMGKLLSQHQTAQESAKNAADPNQDTHSHMYENIIQEVVPTHTGLLQLIVCISIYLFWCLT